MFLSFIYVSFPRLIAINNVNDFGRKKFLFLETFCTVISLVFYKGRSGAFRPLKMQQNGFRKSIIRSYDKDAVHSNV